MSNSNKNQAEFMETLHVVAEIVRTTAEPMSKDEIASYFTDMELSDEQQELVYQYLMTPQPEETNDNAETEDNIEESTFQEHERVCYEEVDDPNEILGKSDVSAEKKQASGKIKTENNSEENNEDAEYPATDLFQMYLDELEEVKQLSEEEEKQLYEKLGAGDESVIAPLAENWLIRVLELAQEQVINDEHLEDVIQEGNMSVFLTLTSLCGAGKKENYEEIISNGAMEAMNSYLVEELSDEMAMKNQKKEETK